VLFVRLSPAMKAVSLCASLTTAACSLDQQTAHDVAADGKKIADDVKKAGEKGVDKADAKIVSVCVRRAVVRFCRRTVVCGCRRKCGCRDR
jgi:hypothetical protein